MSVGDFPESLSQAILEGIVNLCREIGPSCFGPEFDVEDPCLVSPPSGAGCFQIRLSRPAGLGGADETGSLAGSVEGSSRCPVAWPPG